MLKDLLHRNHPHGLPTPYLPHSNKDEDPQGNLAIPLDRQRYVQRGHRNVAVPSVGRKVVWSAARPNLSLLHVLLIFLPDILVELSQTQLVSIGMEEYIFHIRQIRSISSVLGQQ